MNLAQVNGSRMKGWWRAHHFISTVLAGVMLIWPVGQCYDDFRTQFMVFNVYISEFLCYAKHQQFYFTSFINIFSVVHKRYLHYKPVGLKPTFPSYLQVSYSTCSSCTSVVVSTGSNVWVRATTWISQLTVSSLGCGEA